MAQSWRKPHDDGLQEARWEGSLSFMGAARLGNVLRTLPSSVA